MLQSVKKVEIVVSALEVPPVLKILRKNQVFNYTVIENVSGSGEHGLSGDDLLTNTYIMAIFTDVALVEQLAAALKPLLKKLGGIFVVTDAQWIAH
jgi:nitrogen regulatory protein PII